ncbi:MAG: type I DNA topoisomerase [Candidatus Paceibacterota bacterium]
MKLLIVESPAKAKTISKYLDGKFTVKASVGHIRDLPKNNKKAIDIEGGFIPHYEISKGKEKVVAEIKSLAKKADEILLATDPDREGEAIAWHIAQATGLKHPKRVVFHEITKDAVTEAIKHPRAIDENLKQAQEARRVLDRLVGYDLSGIIWKKVRYGLSAGRVQSPALRIIMEREREIRAFVPHNFWIITADLENKTGETKFKLPFVCSQEPTDIKEVERILSEGKKGAWKVIDIKETEVKRSPRPPFITSTLQQAASSRLGFAPSKTMGIAQKLYEAGLITYMRTDSTTLSKVALGQIAGVVENRFGKKYLQFRTFSKKSKNAQEAHEAIRPTNLSKEIAGATDEQKKLYRLIWRRTVASQMTEANTLRTKVIANIDNKETIPNFSVNGSRILFDGWYAVDPAARQEDVELPKMSTGDALNLIELRTEEKSTEPPSRYSEAGLVKELEKRGIGRPSTYASIIKTIVDRGYVEKQNKALVPTDTGDVVSSFLENNFMEYINDSFTAEMEDKLDEIAQGKADYEKTLSAYYKPLAKDVKAKEKLAKATDLGKAPSEFKCPVCGSGMIIKLSRTGKFMSCEKFPDCTGARTIDGKELEGPKETGEKCPNCEKGMLIERDGKFGRFIACNNYPKCKYIKKDAELEKQNSTGVTCPICKKGFMTERRGRFGLFYSCSNYPDCKHIIKSKPTGKICGYMRENGPCIHLMMEGTKTIPDRCSDKTCPNHNPHKLAK